jgi:hypothetical protein
MTTAITSSSEPIAVTAVTATQAAAGLIPARPLAAQAHALCAAAAFIEHAGIAGLSLTIDADRITIQVPAHLAGPAARTAAVAVLAAAAGGQPSRNTTPGAATYGWVSADGQVAGHAVHIFTAIGETP